MPDLSAVEKSLVTAVVSIVYPNGTAQPSIIGKTVTVTRGWPLGPDLDKVLKAGNCKVTVVTDSGGENTTRYLGQDIVTPGVPTIIASASGSMIALRGQAETGQFVGALVGGPTGKCYVYESTATDTLPTIAAGLAALIPGANASGSTITIAGAASIIARSYAIGTNLRENRRQQARTRVICWCPTPDIRDALASAIDNALASTPWLASAGADLPVRLRGAETGSIDTSENAGLYRRDLFYTVEYATTTIEQVAPMMFGIENVSNVELITSLVA